MNSFVFKRGVAWMIVLSFLFVLIPCSIIPVKAEETTSIPILNETIVGTVQFQAFNFLGDNHSNPKEDGKDYNTTFYYTDDYFRKSAVNKTAEESETTKLQWYDLEDVSMATASFDFAVASYNTNIGNIQNKSASSHSWGNTDYSDKQKNARDFLTTCQFEDFKAYNYNMEPTQTSIGYVLAHKEITVFDEVSQNNKKFNLVAVGVRGAGYGQEWASNVEIGRADDPANVGRHKGFNDSATIVCDAITDYINQYNLSENLKYWVVGFSRAAAVANLTAGNLTDRCDDYHTTKQDVYGYTYEAPQGAAASESAEEYTNIHNIINGMDMVPKVSPDEFEHQRLGYDYYMPYYRNTDSREENSTYYNRMYDVLETIATAYDSEGKKDRLLTAADPASYPYNRPMTLYTITPTKLFTDSLAGELEENFGTVEYSGDKDLRDLYDEDLYIDTFIDTLIDVFLVSSSWDEEGAAPSASSKEELALFHRTKFIQYYQEDFRTLFGYFLGYSGPAFMGLVDDVMDGVQSQLALSMNPIDIMKNWRKIINNFSFAYAFYRFYDDPKGSYRSNSLTAFAPSDWCSRPKKNVLIEEAKDMITSVVDNVTDGYEHPTISREQMHTALQHLTGLVINLYADELDLYDSQYFGTTLHCLDQILSTHEPETVLSWIMSLDPNHINRGYRTLTVPDNIDVKIYEFREDIEGPVTEDGDAPLLAEVRNGRLISSLDQRISVSDAENENEVVIRYPSMLDLRADLTTTNEDVSRKPYVVADYMTTSETTDISAGKMQYGEGSNSGSYMEITTDPEKTNAQAINEDASIDSLTSDETIQIFINGTDTYNNSADADAAVYNVRKRENVEMSGMTVSLFSGEISMNFYMRLTRKVLDDDGAYMHFTLPGANHTATEVPVKGKEPTKRDGTIYYVFTAGVAAKDMVGSKEEPKNITAQMVLGDGSTGKQYKSSVREYGLKVMEQYAEKDPGAVKLVKAMLNYGGYTQIYFDHNADNLANEGLDVPLQDVVFAEDEYNYQKSGTCNGLKFRGTRAMLTTTTDLRHYFSFEGDPDDYIFTVNGKTLSLENDPTGDYVAIKSISSKDLFRMMELTVTNKKDGTTFKLEDGVYSYIKRILASDKQTEKAKNVKRALYWYGEAAREYFY